MEFLPEDRRDAFEKWVYLVQNGNISECELNARFTKDAAKTISSDVNEITRGQIDSALRASIAYFLSQRRVPEAPDHFLQNEALRALNNLSAALAEAVVASHAATLRRRSNL